ncbi:hypothetical protein [Aquimarina sediminis]|uniref:hypothetical protein n=1 Tax=Aquimarina sediminis TaxID=2070536 RepID=UPI000CA031F6|nr:hypothetical protein [Aquimarina sediminis]
MQLKFNILLAVAAILMLSSFKNGPDYPENPTVNNSDSLYQEPSKELELVGKWLMEGDFDTYIKLRPDGVAIEKSIGEPSKRYWSVKNDKLCLKATPVEGSTEMCLEYELNEDILILTMNKMRLHYERTKE